MFGFPRVFEDVQNFLHIKMDELPDEGLTAEMRAYLENYCLMKLSLSCTEPVKREDVEIHWFHDEFSCFSAIRIDTKYPADMPLRIRAT